MTVLSGLLVCAVPQVILQDHLELFQVVLHLCLLSRVLCLSKLSSFLYLFSTHQKSLYTCLWNCILFDLGSLGCFFILDVCCSCKFQSMLSPERSCSSGTYVKECALVSVSCTWGRSLTYRSSWLISLGVINCLFLLVWIAIFLVLCTLVRLGYRVIMTAAFAFLFNL